MGKRILWSFILLAACTFDMPGDQGARAECEEFIQAVAERALECGDDPVLREQSSANNKAHCAKVVAKNPLGPSVERCIEDLRSVPCKDRGMETWCNAFL